MSLSFATLGATILTADRTSTVEVSTDPTGALALEANDSIPFVTDSDSPRNTLDIDTSLGGADGINPNATLYFGDGDFDESGTVSAEAYNATNNFGQPVDVQIGYETGGISSGEVVIAAEYDTASKRAVIDSSSPNGTVTFAGVPDGGTIDVAIRAKTGGDDLSGNITHSVST